MNDTPNLEPHLTKLLEKMDDVAFRTLALQVQLATSIRDTQREFNLSDTDMCRELKNLSPYDLQCMKTASFNFTLRDIALIEAARHTLFTKRAQKQADDFSEVITTPIAQERKKQKP